MHTFTGKKGTRIHFDSGCYDGEIIISNMNTPDMEIRVSTEDIIDFVASLIKDERIAQFEEHLDNMDSFELFGLTK